MILKASANEDASFLLVAGSMDSYQEVFPEFYIRRAI
jgi:hypothetical protein